MRIIMVTCARVKSTRTHKKCIRIINGKPLIQYTIDFAKKLKFPYYIYTKDQELIKHAKNCSIIREPEELYDTGDIVGQQRCIAEVTNADVIILLQATSPIRRLELYENWIADFLSSDFDSGFSVSKIDRLNYKMNGAFYIFYTKILKKNINDIISLNSKIYIDEQDIDIDTEKDFERLEKYFEDKNNT